MDDLNQKLSQILNDPESMNRVRQMAESILSDKEEETTDDSIFGSFGSEELGNIMSIVSRLNNQQNDARTSLLLALKPHLSEAKQEKVDTAIKILRLLDLLPILKESGVLGKLL
ncbi:MAG: hypothetical protein E7542_04960 [Ruminococcaceae bacterium]|nr:hypothetical protein [Oscillospiraceae bacterium]